MHVAHLERTGHYLTIKDNQIVQVSKDESRNYLTIKEIISLVTMKLLTFIHV